LRQFRLVLRFFLGVPVLANGVTIHHNSGRKKCCNPDKKYSIHCASKMLPAIVRCASTTPAP
jgi:hypothetical protein